MFEAYLVSWFGVAKPLAYVYRGVEYDYVAVILYATLEYFIEYNTAISTWCYLGVKINKN